MKTYNQVMADIREELDYISEMCVKEGYPSNGSNYELRAAEVWKWYEEQYPEYFGDESEDNNEDETNNYTEKNRRREIRLNLEKDAKRRKAKINKICKSKKRKAEHDGEMIYFRKGALEWEIHDSKLWKPMNNKAKTSIAKTLL